MILENIKDAIDRYVKDGLKPGSFTKAVLENNLMEAFRTADLDSRENLFEICEYVYNHIPSDCHGSPEIVQAWMD